MPIFSQFGEIVWQRLFNIVRILQTTALEFLIKTLVKNLSRHRQVVALEFLFVDKSVNVPKIQDKPLFSGALGRNRERVNNIWNAKNFFHVVETKKLINSYVHKKTANKRLGELEEGNFVTLANKIQNELRNWQSTPEIYTLEKSSPN